MQLIDSILIAVALKVFSPQIEASLMKLSAGHGDQQLGILMFDGMTISRGVTYSTHTGRIYGFPDLQKTAELIRGGYQCTSYDFNHIVLILDSK